MVQDDGGTGPLFGLCARPVEGGDDGFDDFWCKIMIVVLIITFFFFAVGLVTT